VRIAAISVAPLFPDLVIGGSQKILIDVAIGLNRSGHEVEIWCTGTPAYKGDFEIDGVTVHPQLGLRGTFPATHQVPPIELSITADALRRAAEWGDKVYLHADAVYLRHTLEGAEIIRSIHDYVYEEALVSTLSFPADATIVPSEYLKNCIEATIALSGRKTIEPIVVVPNGVHVPEVLPDPMLPKGIAPRAENDLILLFPHRPQAAKGLEVAIRLAVKKQATDDGRNVRLLMPVYPEDSNFDEAAGSITELNELVRKLGASDIVEFHGWLSPEDMPGYYAAGDVTLCLGSFIESFGLVPVESVANGTPVACARVGALREFDGIDGIFLEGYDWEPMTAHSVDLAIDCSDKQIASGRAQISAKYPMESMISGYESVLSESLKGERQITIGESGRLVLAPWCDIQGDRIYDDYRANRRIHRYVSQALRSGEGFIDVDPPPVSERHNHLVKTAVAAGILIPEYEIV
jgi:glycosyltransferase involved in cell wall biosynthesis